MYPEGNSYSVWLREREIYHRFLHSIHEHVGGICIGTDLFVFWEMVSLVCLNLLSLRKGKDPIVRLLLMLFSFSLIACMLFMS